MFLTGGYLVGNRDSGIFGAKPSFLLHSLLELSLQRNYVRVAVEFVVLDARLRLRLVRLAELRLVVVARLEC